jgi:hypothetical protein
MLLMLLLLLMLLPLLPLLLLLLLLLLLHLLLPPPMLTVTLLRTSSFLSLHIDSSSSSF